MSKFLKEIVIFGLVVIISYPIFIIGMGEVAPKILQKNLPYKLGAYGHMKTRIQEIKDYGDVDVVILGSSHAYRGFDVRLFSEKGIKAFNLGSSAQSPIQSNLLIQRYFDDLTPELVIVEVYPETVCGDGLESSLDIIANDEIKGDYLGMLWDIPNTKLFNSLIFSFYKQRIRGDLSYTEAKRIKDDTYISGGYVEKDLKRFKHQELEENSSEWKINDTQIKALHELIGFCESKSSKVVLVQAPITKALRRRYKNNEEYDEYLSSITDYINFNSITVLDDSLHFSDPHHLNQEGVVVFNSDLFTYISKYLK